MKGELSTKNIVFARARYLILRKFEIFRSDPDLNFVGSCSEPHPDPNEHDNQDPDPNPNKVCSDPQHFLYEKN